MNLTTIATTTLLIGLGLIQPLSAETLENTKHTVANAKPIKVDWSNSSLPSANAKQLYIQIGIQPYYYNPVYWSWGLFFGDYYYDYYNPYYSGYGYYDDRYYGNRYYGSRYRREYNYYYSADQIRDIYREVLGREPDNRGLRTWLGERRSGESLGEIRRDIARSDEAVTKINQIYREVLGRNVDRDGIRTWTNRLASGASIYEVRRDIENSPEARSLRNRRYPAYNPSVNYSQPRRYAPPTTVYPPTRTLPSRDYGVPVRTFPSNTAPAVRYPTRNLPSNTAPAVRYPTRNLPPATLSPSDRTPSRRYSPPENYQQPTRRNSPSRRNVPTTDNSLPSRRNSGSNLSPSIPSTAPRIQR
ncbi:MAG: DUF4214 domain-containing protein [Phormidium sp.]